MTRIKKHNVSFFRSLQWCFRFDSALFFVGVILIVMPAMVVAEEKPKIDAADLAKVKQFEKLRIDAVEKVIGSVIAVYGEERQGGGSGVIIDPSGIGLTNHHVIGGAGVRGWGGLADGKLYRWELIGTDPGGDVAIIQMKGKDEFPFTPLADSGKVQVGDWALAMGNPFVLTEDQSPTVTLGIVSGVKRYQWGAGKNQLVYGNCIQTDSSINPGNSGGPLFNLDGQVIGINGRGSFKERGRVNVGLGYAISANQIKNFIPDLLATKLVEHGTLDANFEDRKGKVVCSNLYEDAKLYKLGVRPGDELLEFEGEPIETAHEFTNLVCTLPEDWPASLKIRKKDGKELSVHLRLYGLPYGKPPVPRLPPNEKDQTPEQKEQIKRAMEMVDLLSAPPGTVRKKKVNSSYVKHIVDKWHSAASWNDSKNEKQNIWSVNDKVIDRDGKELGTQQIAIDESGQFMIESDIDGEKTSLFWDGKKLTDLNDQKTFSLVEAKLKPSVVQAIGIAAANKLSDLDFLGDMTLDGGDKAQNRQSYRFKLLDEDEDPFFFWLGMFDNEGHDDVSLLKAGADLDCARNDGGVTFHSWKSVNGFRYASERKSIKGLAEKEQQTFKTISCEKIAMEWPPNSATGEKTNDELDAENPNPKTGDSQLKEGEKQ